MGENLYISKNCYKPLNLNTGSELKRFIELVGKSQGMKKGEVVVSILRQLFPKCQDEKWHEWIKAAAKSENRNVTGWVRENIPPKVPLKHEGLHTLSVVELAELFGLARRFKFTTFCYNAMGYIKSKNGPDLAWRVALVQSLDKLRDYYEKGETEFYNPLEK